MAGRCRTSLVEYRSSSWIPVERYRGVSCSSTRAARDERTRKDLIPSRARVWGSRFDFEGVGCSGVDGPEVTGEVAEDWNDMATAKERREAKRRARSPREGWLPPSLTRIQHLAQPLHTKLYRSSSACLGCTNFRGCPSFAPTAHPLNGLSHQHLEGYRMVPKSLQIR